MRRFFSGTLLSRISGLGRDLAMAFAFGDHPSVAAFMVAFRLSNLLRRLLGEGPFQSAFIPYFEGLRVQDSEKAKFFFHKLTALVAILLFFIVMATEGMLSTLLTLGWLSEGNQEIVRLTCVLFPSIIFICLYGLNISLLNCHNSFFIPSVAPVICNTVWIVAALLMKNADRDFAMFHLSKWIFIGFVGQWLLTLPLTVRYAAGHWKEWFCVAIPVEVKQLAKSFSLGAIGVGAAQINAFADAFFARYADLRGPVYLWYSIRLEQLLLAIFGIACVSTVIPTLSRAIKGGNLEFARSLFSQSCKRIMVIMIPCTFGIFALGLHAVNLIYGQGNFSEQAVLKTTVCLFAYALGLVPTTLIMLYAAIYYAEHHFRKPMVISVLSVMINLILNFIFVAALNWGAVSIALATSLSTFINCIILWKLLKGKGWESHFSFYGMYRVMTSSLFALLCAAAVDSFLFEQNFLALFNQGTVHLSSDLLAKIKIFTVQSMVFCLGLAIHAVATKNQDILGLFKELFRFKKVAV